jgi:hypothetical protein
MTQQGPFVLQLGGFRTVEYSRLATFANGQQEMVKGNFWKGVTCFVFLHAEFRDDG